MNEQHWNILATGQVIVSNSPEELWDGAKAYFKWCDDHPIRTKKTLTSGKEAGKVVENEYPRPYTIKGLCLHCGIQEEYLRDLRQSRDKTSLYYIAVSRMMYIIYVQNAELATVGVYNPIFTAKMLNMENNDTTPSNIRVEIVQGLPELSKTENEILEKMELEMRGGELS